MLDLNTVGLTTEPQADTITVLYHPTATATKTWFLDGTGRMQCVDYGCGEYFSTFELNITGLEGLYWALASVSQEPHAFIIRGKKLPNANPQHLRRAKNPKNGQAPGFYEVGRRWLTIDADSVDVPFDPLRPEVSAAAVVSKLVSVCEAFAGCSYVWQLSSSAGIKSGFRGHLWFWIDHPCGQKELETWGSGINDRAGCKLIDTAVFRTVQPIYVADPIFGQGMGTDPLKGRRLGFVRGNRECVSLPVSTAHGPDWREFTLRLRDPATREIHDHIRDACGRYFCEHGAEASEGVLKRELQEAVAAALQLQKRPAGEYGETEIDSEIASGRDYARRQGALGGSLQLDLQGQPRSNAYNVAMLMKSPDWAGVLRYNERALQCEIVQQPPWKGGESFPRPINDEDGIRLAVWLNENHKVQAGPTQAYQHLVAECKDHPYDRVQDYLQELEWDGVGRAHLWLTTYYGVRDSLYTRRVGIIFLVSAVARALDPGCQVDTVPILEGDQGIYKTQALKALFGEDFVRDNPPDIAGTNKDALQYLHGPWCVEVQEIDTYFARPRSVGELKKFVTSQRDDFRPPYGKSTQSFRRRCIMVGTTNETEYLTDPTGNRRYLPVWCARADLDGLRRDRDALWAEAVTLYRGRVEWHFDARDPLFVTEQKARLESDPWEDAIASALEQGAPQGPSGMAFGSKTPAIPKGTTQVTCAQLLEHAIGSSVESVDRHKAERVGRIMLKLGWKRNRIGVKRYFEK
jgi:hypothetical protein